MPVRRALAALAVAAALAAPACGSGADSKDAAPPTTASTTTTVPTITTTTAPPALVVAVAGDIACPPGLAPAPYQCQQAATAGLVAAAHPALVLTLGDNQYENGRPGEYDGSYAGTWGAFKAITRPSPGNHEYNTDGIGYYAYFGAAAGPAGKGWYSFDAGGWHIVSLNSNCAAAGGCNTGTPQNEWLRADLAASHARCTLAFWHHPRFSSGPHGDDASVQPLWEVLRAAGADVVLNGHDHDYERFAPLSPAGTPDPEGMREFVVGTGGRNLYPTFLPHTGSEIRHASGFGILVLDLRPDDYRWHWAGLPGDPFTDAGEGQCH
ncbi:MAG TPA: metallophosphoesterase [Acidimicrobiales bacterium]|nr:metallophosphoesterase [Acidimicrobiales bacterium]